MLKYFLLSLVLLNEAYVNGEYIRGCYYTNWAQYRPGIGLYYPENYVAGLCTHIFYAFASMTPDYQISPYEWNDLNTSYSEGMYSRVLALKKQQPDLKVSLSFAGWNYCQEYPELLDSMAASSTNRQTFITSVLALLNQYGFDGFDIDWEYPSVKTDFSSLLRDFRTAFDNNVPRLLLTIAGGANPAVIDASYEASVIGQYLDFLNVMTYDFNGAWQMTTGQNSPLYDCYDSMNFSISDAINKWISDGFPRNKINIGLAAYGRGWTLVSASNNSIGAPCNGASPAQPYTREAGVIAYYEACTIIQDGGIQTFDYCEESPDVQLGTQWYTYDNMYSFNIKLNWLKDNGLAGAFVWTLDMDDFTGTVCTSSDGNKYPLIQTVKANLLGNQPYTTQPVTTRAHPTTRERTTKRVVTKATSRPTTSAGDFQCPGFGFYPDPDSCYSYYECIILSVPYKKTCDVGLCFNTAINECDFLRNCPNCPQQPSTEFLPTTKVSTTRRAARTTVKQRTTNPTTEVTSGPTAPTMSTTDAVEFQCPGPGYYPDPDSCYDFYECNSNNASSKINCPPGLCFNKAADACDYPINCPNC